MKSLYPIKFNPIYKDKIWGGTKIKTILNKNIQSMPNCGESWELSGVEDNVSVAANGFLAGINLEEIIKVYGAKLLGEKIYKKFGNEFPLLIKFIDAKDNLSIQVHPDDELSKERHKSYGKTEMWYVVDAEENSELISGFNSEIDKATYLDYVKNSKLDEILNFEKVSAGDAFFIPAGRVHAIGKNILLAEIQQTSDITYRIYDFDRTDDSGNTRELHTDLAVDAIDYTFFENYKTNYDKQPNRTSEIVKCNYFTTNVVFFDKTIEKDYTNLDAFIIYMCIDGEITLEYNQNESIDIKKGETILIPADLKLLKLSPKSKAEILEVYIEL